MGPDEAGRTLNWFGKERRKTEGKLGGPIVHSRRKQAELILRQCYRFPCFGLPLFYEPLAGAVWR